VEVISHSIGLNPFSSLWPIELSAKYMHLVSVMKHKKYNIRVVSNTKRDIWIFLGILLYFAAAFIGIILVLAEAPVK